MNNQFVFNLLFSDVVHVKFNGRITNTVLITSWIEIFENCRNNPLPQLIIIDFRNCTLVMKSIELDILKCMLENHQDKTKHCKLALLGENHDFTSRILIALIKLKIKRCFKICKQFSSEETAINWHTVLSDK